MSISIRLVLSFKTALILFTACTKFKEEKRVAQPTKGDSVFITTISNAKCENCQAVIEDGLLKEKGIKQAILNLQTKRLTVVYNFSLNTKSKIIHKLSELQPKMPCNK
jgi:hypothetical protein